ncbi:MAG TPA: hypothetical protein VFK02_02020 [Kofleriaceae bacterium]|nr:hypothetical protein [Kofleriaceae bacterium]
MKSRPRHRSHEHGHGVAAVGARTVTAVALFAGTIVTVWRLERFRADYWAQLSPWVTFLAGGFAVLAGTLVFVYWRLAERSQSYLRLGEKLPFGDETALLAAGPRTLIVGRAPFVEVVDLPPRVMHALYVATVLGIALIGLDNRAVALLREVPSRLGPSSIDYCKPPEPPKPETRPSQGCKLVERAFKLGYTTSLGSCAPAAAKREVSEVCTRRQLDEPYLHYAWRRLVDRVDDVRTADAGPGSLDRLEHQLDHLPAIAHATLDTVAMRARSSHHLFTNLPDPRPGLGDRAAALLARSCGARLAHLAHFPRMEDGPTGPSKLFEHVLGQLMFSPSYKPIVAACEEVIVHWAAPPDTCARLVDRPVAVLDQLGALDAVRGVLASRATSAETRSLGPARPTDLPPAQRIVSFQCLMFDPAATLAPPVERTLALDGERFTTREVRMTPLVGDGGSQIRLYKQLAALLAPGFGYGRLTSNQAVGATAEEAALARAFGQPVFWLTKLDLLRDADLFLGNDWLTRRPDLLEVYPYHLHLQNFIEIFRRQYLQHQGRL